MWQSQEEFDCLQKSNRIYVGANSIIGIKYNKGILLVSDTLLCYGSLKKYTNISKYHVVGTGTEEFSENPLTAERDTMCDTNSKNGFFEKNILIAGSGEYSDFQKLVFMVEEKALEDYYHNVNKGASDYAAFVSKVYYSKRCKFDPMLNRVIVAGLNKTADGSLDMCLGYVDQFGTFFEDNYAATGLASHYSLPMIRKEWNKDMSENQAYELLEKCMKVVFYRDCSAARTVQFANITSEGINLCDPCQLEVTWRYDGYLKSCLELSKFY